MSNLLRVLVVSVLLSACTYRDCTLTPGADVTVDTPKDQPIEIEARPKGEIACSF